MIVKIHKTNHKKIIAICDPELIGKKIKFKKLQLDLNSNFYKGEEKTEKEIAESIKTAYILNITGEKSISLALKLNVISKEDIIYINKIPHCQSVLY